MRPFGSFTSSQIYRLMSSDRKGTGFGKTALTYIDEVRWTSILKRPVNVETFAVPTAWGNAMERYAFDNLTDLDWTLVSDVRIKHDTLPWSGAPDIVKTDAIGDIKCPFGLNSLMHQRECFGNIDRYRSEYPEYYWQLVSNAHLAGVRKATAVLFCPTIEMLSEIMTELDGDDQHGWIASKPIKSLPYLIEGTIDPITVWSFDVPSNDEAALIERVEMATELMNQITQGSRLPEIESSAVLGQDKCWII